MGSEGGGDVSVEREVSGEVWSLGSPGRGVDVLVVSTTVALT